MGRKRKQRKVPERKNERTDVWKEIKVLEIKVLERNCIPPFDFELCLFVENRAEG